MLTALALPYAATLWVAFTRDRSASALAELAIYTVLVVAYFFLVLSFLPSWLKHLFDQDKLVYALVVWALIAVQGVVLETLTSQRVEPLRCYAPASASD